MRDQSPDTGCGGEPAADLNNDGIWMVFANYYNGGYDQQLHLLGDGTRAGSARRIDGVADAGALAVAVRT
jgi:hypothetical protein